MRRVKAHLKEHLRNYISGGIVLAYSGGVDSSVLLAVLSEMNKETPFRLRAVIFDSAFQTGAGLTEAFERAMRSGVDVRKEKLDQLAIAGHFRQPGGALLSMQTRIVRAVARDCKTRWFCNGYGRYQRRRRTHLQTGVACA